MTKPVAALLAELRPDPWRAKSGFSAEVDAANATLFDHHVADGAAVVTLGQWLERHQPCLFGRIAAKLGLITYCVLTEGDLMGSDDQISGKIQDARTSWTRDGFEGRKSSFIVFVRSFTIAHAVPDEHMKELARRLCSLYLLESIE